LRFPATRRVACRFLLLTLGSAPATGCRPYPGGRGGAEADSRSVPHAKPTLEGARELDQQGVKAFAEGRYGDAVVLFRASRALGGPPSETWNVARCLERIDDAEGASRVIDEYLAASDLSPQDRTEAEREGRALKGRPSPLTVTTSPPGASVWVDGQALGGPTPASFEVRPGTHALAVKRAGYSTESLSVEARFGRAIVVALDLVAPRK